MTTRARHSLLDKNIGMSTRFYTYIIEKSHTKNAMYFLDGGRGSMHLMPLVWLCH